MVKIQILKNGKLVKQFFSPKNMFQKWHSHALDVAGGMYNGKDKFTVISENV